MEPTLLAIGLEENDQTFISVSLGPSYRIESTAGYEDAVNHLKKHHASIRLILISTEQFIREGNISDFVVEEYSSVIPLPLLCIDHSYATDEEALTTEENVYAHGAVGYFCLPRQMQGLINRIGGVTKLSDELFRTQRNAEILHSEFEIVLSNYSGGVIIAHNDAGSISYLYKNREFYAMFGYTEEQFEEELAGRFHTLIVPEFYPEVTEKINASIQNGQTVQFDFMAVRRDGTFMWVHLKNSVCVSEELKKQVYVTIFTDITRERETEERIRALNKEIAGWEIFVQLNVTSKRVKEYHSAYTSAVIADRLLQEADFYEEYIVSAVYEEDREAIYDAISYHGMMKHFESGDTKYSVEYRRYTPSGELLWFAVTVVLLQDRTNYKVNAFLYSRNIDMKMKSRIAKNYIVDMDVEDITIINIKKKTCHVIHVERSSTIESGEAIYFSNVIRYVNGEVVEEDRERCMRFFSIDSMLEEISERGYAEISFLRLSQSGSNRRMNARVTYLDNTHNDLLMIGRDITDLFEQEQEKQILLQHAVDLANLANDEKTKFLSRMSHDMRTPLNAMIGLTELALKNDNCQSTGEYLIGIESSSRYLLGLINDMLDLSKIESGKMELHPESYTLDEFVFGIKTVIKPLMDEKNIEFVMNLKDDVNVVHVDKMRFSQIFYNLLSNAAKYTPNGGRVEFSSEEIPGKNEEFGMRFQVTDNGIGMSQEYLRVLFDPFTREERPETRERKGTGLGLAIVKEIVDLFGGSISVESELNKGTTFTVDLYARALNGQVTEKSETALDFDKLNQLHVLLADDNEINSMIFNEFLTNKGCIVDMVTNGLEALETFQGSPEGYYSLILTDVRMPVMDGLEEARRIRALDRTDAGTIPIIASTADAYTDMMEKILNAGMNTRVVKPVKAEELYRTIIELL